MSNVDPNEIHKFNTMAPEWWDPNGPMKPLHQLNPLRLDYINRQAPLRNKKVLDIGCGGGLLAEAMAKEGAIVTGIDMSAAALGAAKQHAEQHQVNVDYQETTIEEFTTTHPHSFDVITCLEMLEHVPNPQAVVASCQQALKPGGTVFFSTINRNPKAFLMAIVGAEYILNLLPKGTHEYKKLIKPSELNAFAEQAHLQLENMVGVHYNPLSGRFWFGKNVDVNYMMCYRYEPTN